MYHTTVQYVSHLTMDHNITPKYYTAQMNYEHKNVEKAKNVARDDNDSLPDIPEVMQV